jgi:hypothetical protein
MLGSAIAQQKSLSTADSKTTFFHDICLAFLSIRIEQTHDEWLSG